MVVLDISAAICVVIDSQATAASRAFFAGDLPGFVAPFIFPVEMRNALVKARRRGLLSRPGLEQAVADLDLIVSARSWAGMEQRYGRLLAIAEREQLSFFDTTYLDLAECEKLPLASRDTALINAAQRRGVPVHDLR